MLCCLRGTETSSVVEEKPMYYAVDEQQIGAGSDDVEICP